MATLAELQAEVARIVQDDSYTTPIIMKYLNQSVTDICLGVPVIWSGGDQTLLGPMEELYTIGTVSTLTTTYKVVLPSNFQRDVVFVAHENGYEITLYEHIGDFRRISPGLDMTGSVFCVSVLGGYIYYQGIPSSSETLTLHYSRVPTEMSQDDDTPDGIPARYHRTLLVYDTCLRIFRQLYEEDTESHGVIASYEFKRMTELISLASSQASPHGSVVFRCR